MKAMRETLLHIMRRLALAVGLLGACVVWTYAAFAQQPTQQPSLQPSLQIAPQPLIVPLNKTESFQATLTREALPLGKTSKTQPTANDTRPRAVVEPASMWRTAMALGAVLGLILILAWGVKKLVARGAISIPGMVGGMMSGMGAARAPSGVIEVLARYPVCTGTSLLLLKLDRRVLLISQSANRGLRSGATLATLCELDQPEDVASILLKVRGDEQAKLAAKFESILSREEAITDQALAEATAPQSPASTRRAKVTAPGPTLHVPSDESGTTRTGRQALTAIQQRLARAEPPPDATPPLPTRDRPTDRSAVRPIRSTNIVASLLLLLSVALSTMVAHPAMAQGSRIGPPLPDIAAPQPSIVPGAVPGLLPGAGRDSVLTPRSALGFDLSNATSRRPDLTPGIDATSGFATGINPLEVLARAGDQLPGTNTGISPRSSGSASASGLSTAINILIVLTVISLAPSIMLMTTCFVRILIVLGLLRQALGTTSIPPPQVISAMALFMTLLVMSPTLDRINNEAVQPYRAGTVQNYDELWNRAKQPMRDYMFAQIEATGNWNSLYLVLEYRGIDVSQPEQLTRAKVDMISLIPAYMLSELKVAFLMGFKLYLPFLVIDMVISTLLIAMGMMMLPPVLISLPFKLLLFVLVDGWALVVGGLLSSFAQPETVASLADPAVLRHLALVLPSSADAIAATRAVIAAASLGRLAP